MAGAAADLTARLQAWADAHGTDLAAARLRVLHERLLARMDTVAPFCWVVRGSRAIDLRLDGRVRRTADLDVSTARTAAQLTAVSRLLTEVCRADTGGGWRFTVMRIDRSLVKGIGVVGFKAWLAAWYDSRPFGEFSVDISTAAAVTITPLELSVPDLLTGAPLRVTVVRAEVQIAEKVHAITRPWPAGQRRARSYDLVDAVAMVLAEQPDLTMLRTAAHETFRARGTHALPGALGAAPPEWASAFEVHGPGYGLAHLTSAQGMAILSAAWQRAMQLPPGRTEAG